ncbi:fatty acid cis/trans isomerase [Candidatus Nitrospira allomarina]|uniref:Fatty acid cis/trans isomerase n=1 Tax=Candidatus Nitrospira allomarina TaxID=3020900 RepID=A0AA96JRJ7_9BACT|nr:fatty acid cis/trans isomerase [Candidatus Nitrospira allomarina]WNM57582.1 fatty acid cis/trans isomerase [Candidatus Nitrospira allomarina]
MNTRPSAQIVFTLLLTIIGGGCTLLVGLHLDQQFGKSSPQNRLTTTPGVEVRTVKYAEDVKPILENRCIVCHGCYDAPCQLNLSAPEGIERGANKDLVYHSGRILAMEPTRLFVDAHSSSEWREKQFYPVLNERVQTKEANLKGSLMAKMLELKRQHPLPTVSPLPADFDFSLERAQYCPTLEEFNDFAETNPLWGMPYGLPGLSDREYGTVRTWLEEGAGYEASPPLGASPLANISKWETFFNGNSRKERLMSRYLYEHLFLAHLYFENDTPGLFFRLVRSTTPPGSPIDIIATRRPYDDPKVARIYYRLEPVRTTILAKTHMPYVLNTQRMERYHTLFLAPEYDVPTLPSYDPEASANPFETFERLPVKSRYQFLLDEAEFTLMNFIKGPVCRGQIALNVINEHFWIVFGNPDSPALAQNSKFLEKEQRNLRMPTEQQSNAGALKNWLEYSKLEKKYFAGKVEYLRQHLSTPEEINLDLIWDGDGRNANAALTVFRHLDNATVVKGFVGDEPKTLVLLDYALLERIHYLLVAGYDIYGNIGHQLNSRLYMDFLRMEGELGFLTFLPERTRADEWKFWYRDASSEIENFGEVYNQRVNRQTGIHFTTAHPKSELVEMLRQHLKPVLSPSYAIEEIDNTHVRQQLKKLSRIQGVAVSWLPQNIIVSISGSGSTAPGDLRHQVVTLIHNNGLSNVSHLFFEQERRIPAEDTLTVVPGFLGAYPNALYHVEASQLQDFVSAVETLSSEEDYQALVGHFGVSRSDPDFWKHSDALRIAYQKESPIEAGLLDYNRLENW